MINQKKLINPQSNQYTMLELFSTPINLIIYEFKLLTFILIMILLAWFYYKTRNPLQTLLKTAIPLAAYEILWLMSYTLINHDMIWSNGIWLVFQDNPQTTLLIGSLFLLIYALFSWTTVEKLRIASYRQIIILAATIGVLFTIMNTTNFFQLYQQSALNLGGPDPHLINPQGYTWAASKIIGYLSWIPIIHKWES